MNNNQKTKTKKHSAIIAAATMMAVVSLFASGHIVAGATAGAVSGTMSGTMGGTMAGNGWWEDKPIRRG